MGGNDPSLQDKKNTLQRSIDSHYTEKAKGARIRSKAQWIENGEKPTKYFFALEKSRQSKKHISSLKTDEGETINTTAQIQEQERFYTLEKLV